MLLIRLIAYRLQANAFGDLDRATKRLLDTISKADRGNGNDRKTSVPARPDLRSLLPGTHLIREHEGVLDRA